jgi:hypothetical protein
VKDCERFYRNVPCEKYYCNVFLSPCKKFSYLCNLHQLDGCCLLHVTCCISNPCISDSCYSCILWFLSF